MIPIRKIEKVRYSGKVYNLQTTSHTYTTFTGVVHTCISKHLLASTMRVMEVGTKALKSGDKKDAWYLFEKAFKLYSLFWGINLKVVDIGDVPMEEKEITYLDEKQELKGLASPLDKFGKIFKKALDCCKE